MANDYLMRLLQLKYPTLPQRLTAFEVQAMLEDLCYVSSDYSTELSSFHDPEVLASVDRVVQLPFVSPERKEKTQEELERIAERKKAASERLVEQTRLMRQEKAEQNENDLEYYTQVKKWKDKETQQEYLTRLESEGFESEQEFERIFKRLDAAVRKARGGDNEDDDKKPPSFPLVDVQDTELDEEGLKEKRRQRLLKAGYEARQRAKAEKEAEALQAAAEAEREAREQRENPTEWLSRVRQKRQDTLNRIQERKRLREALPDRKSAAAQQRMKSITALASDQAPASRRRKRGEEEDTFGADDSDWHVYRAINDATNSEDEREEHAELERLESKLLEHDDDFTEEHTYAAILSRKSRLINTFLRGFEPPWDPEDAAQFHQVHLNVERIRVPEVSWQPLMAGVDQAGVGELSRHVLHAFDASTRNRMARNVLVTGRYASLPGFDLRLASVLRASLPPGAPLLVQRARSARFDPWRGMRAWVNDQPDVFRTTSLSRADYEEKGADWFLEHALSSCWRS